MFETSVNVRKGGKVLFNLTYQQVLTRVHGVYKHVINIVSTQVTHPESYAILVHPFKYFMILGQTGDLILQRSWQCIARSQEIQKCFF